MKKTFHKSDSRGFTDLGWLQSYHTFNFGDFRQVSRSRFGLLRVINDDVIAPTQGFGTHSHANMEIISIPLFGSLKHQDSLGNVHVIKAGEVQIMSAGSGISHSEFNASETDSAGFLQIWVFPNVNDTPPGYSQKKFELEGRKNRLQLIASSDGSEGSVTMKQDAYFYLSHLNKGVSLRYAPKDLSHGVYFFLIEGVMEIADQELTKRDGLGVEDAPEIAILAREESQLLIIEVPMKSLQRD